jgi:autophagy-related protein 13
MLNQDLQEWRSMDATVERPAPLVIDVYLDTAQLAPNQTLVAMDEQGKPWDVTETLRRLEAQAPTPQNHTLSTFVYERWTISLDDPSSVSPATLNEPAPSFYKKGVITCRALCTYARLLPAWKLRTRLGKQAATGPATLRPRYRVSDGSLAEKSRVDTLSCSIFPSDKHPTETYRFSPLHCPLGSLNISVTYRKNLDLQVELSERLISARMAGHERPDSRLSSESSRERTSIDQERPSSRPKFSSSSFQRASQRSTTLGTSPRTSSFRDPKDRPISAQAIDEQDTSQPSSQQDDQLRRYSSQSQRDREASRFAPSSLQPIGIQRRPSVSFQPFKAGSLSSSPAAGNLLSSSPSSSIGRSAGNPLLAHARKSSLSTLPQMALRNPGAVAETAVGSSASSSPKPAPIQRYSSSFSNRRARFPSVSSSRVEEDNNSSGRASVSSTNRESSTLQEGEGGASSGSVQGDEDNIADFLKLLDRNKGLSGLNKTDKASLNANSQRTASQYSKFTRMKDSTGQLSESLQSSTMLHRSSSSSSRQLQNVPGMIPGSISTSSSPGKPISPHTPHIPAIPSRLSNNSITADSIHDRSRSRLSGTQLQPLSDRAREVSTHPLTRGSGTPLSTAIDIPTSPRTFVTNRRSSSTAQQPRARGVTNVEHQDAYGMRSASMPIAEGGRGELSLSELLSLGEGGSTGSGGAGGSSRRRNREGSAIADDDEPLLFALAD